MIKQILDMIGEKQRELMMLAFNTGGNYLLEYKPGKFIAVNLVPSENHIVEEVVGRWSRGTLAGKTDVQETEENVS